MDYTVQLCCVVKRGTRLCVRATLSGPEAALSDPESVSNTEVVREAETYWTGYSAGDRSAGWEPPTERRTLLLLVSGGPFQIDAGGNRLVLSERGDHVMLRPGDTYRWRASSAATILSIRWLSPRSATD